MHRRQALVSAGLALSALSTGCIAGDGGDPADEPADDSDDGTDPDPAVGDGSNGEERSGDPDSDTDPDVAVLPDDGPELPGQPDGIDGHFTTFENEAAGLVGSIPRLWYRTGARIRVHVRVVEEPDADAPLTLGAWVENRGSTPAYLRPQDIPPFDAPREARIEGYADRHPEKTGPLGSLMLRATSEGPFIDGDPGYQRGRDGIWRPPDNERFHRYPDRIRIDPDQTLYGEFVVLAPRGGGDIQQGTYDVSRGDPGFRIVLWERDHPGPLNPPRLAGTEVPDLDEDGTKWFHDADADAETFLYPSAEIVSTPAELTFTFVNHSREDASGNPYGWTLYKLVDDEWFQIAPWFVLLPLTFVSPGETYTWTRRLFAGPGLHRGPETSPGGTDGNSNEIGHLGGGLYAFEGGMSVGGGDPAALFELVGDPIEVTATDDLEIVSDEPGELVLEDRRWRQEDEGRRQVLQLTATDEAADAARRVIPEQVMQPHNHAVRNLLAHRDASEEVRLRTNRSIPTIVPGLGEDPALLAFDGAVYRIADVQP